MTSGVTIPNINSYKLNVTLHEDHHKQIEENGETITWRKEKELGKGGFGSVRLEKAVIGGAEPMRAVKRILRGSSTTNNLYIQREVKALIMVQDHLNLFVKFYGWYEDDFHFFIAMEYAPFGDLGSYIKSFKEDAHSNAIIITQQLLKALVILHERKIYHRDLKPPNVLITSLAPLHVKLADFGASKSTINTMLRTQCGTATYQAPEMQGLSIQRHALGGEYPFALDMWSLGCMVYELLTTEAPFLEEPVPEEEVSEVSWISDDPPERSINMAMLVDFCEEKIDFPLQPLHNASVSLKGIDFVTKLLVASPEFRMTAQTALKHDWFTQLGSSDAYFEDIANELISLGINSTIAKSLIRAHREGPYPERIRDILNAVGKNYISLAYDASHKGHTSLLDLLLKTFKGDTNLPHSTIKGWTLLQTAAKEGHLGVVKLLLGWGANINAEAGPFWRGRTALQAAAESGNTKLVRFLLENGADIHAKTAQKGGLTALQAAASYGFTEVLVDLVKKHKAEVNEKPCDLDGRTALQAAAGNGQEGAVDFLLRNGAEVNSMPCKQKGRTALQAAAGGGFVHIVEMLLEKSADVNAEPCSLWGRTAIQAAAENGHADVVQLLLENSADVNAGPCEKKGKTALWAAAEGGHSNIVRLLLEFGADINCNICGSTALEIAEENGHHSIVELLSDNSF
ncbi:kinase-like domain-containing protein [Morchella snyderi]|nr:kinase-like domain-containing protein [Morchella snyderi]